MKLVRWKRFTWQLAKLPPLELTLPAPYTIRAAGREEVRVVTHVVQTAFSLDSTWSDTLNLFRDRLDHPGRRTVLNVCGSTRRRP